MTDSPWAEGLSKRGKVVGGVLLLVLLAAILTLVALNWESAHHPGALTPPSSAQQDEVIATLMKRVEQAYGPTLDSVAVRYGRQDHIPVFFTSFRLKGVPLDFSFVDEDSYVLQYGDSFSGLTSPELIGGPAQFVALARQFHRDFPAEKSMSEQRAYAGNLPAPLPQLAEGMKPTVLVYSRDADVGDLTKVLGVYAWDATSGAWRLLQRGPLPEPGGGTEG
jgi:hypothetical protein